MLYLRSLLFNVVFYVNLLVFMIGGAVFYVTPRRWSVEALKVWARVSLWWLKVLAGTRFEVRGGGNVPRGAALVAGKHQSLWETFAILPLLDDPAVVLKRELMWIPLFGWFAFKFKMIAVDRAAGPTALNRLVERAKAAIGAGRQIVVFPEGTRRPPGAPPAYKPGATALYLRLGVPCVPFALNSGVFWPRRGFLRRPGTIVIEFLTPIPPGFDRKTFEARLEYAVEAASTRLLTEAREQVDNTRD